MLPKLVAALKCLAKRCSSGAITSPRLPSRNGSGRVAISIAEGLAGVRRVIDALDLLANRQSIAGDGACAGHHNAGGGAARIDGRTRREPERRRAMLRLRQSTLLTRLQRFEGASPWSTKPWRCSGGMAQQSPHAYAHLYLEAVDLAGGCRVRLGLPTSRCLPRGSPCILRAAGSPRIPAVTPTDDALLGAQIPRWPKQRKSYEALTLAERAASMVPLRVRTPRE